MRRVHYDFRGGEEFGLPERQGREEWRRPRRQHPAKDKALGTSARYGLYQADPLHESTFSLPYRLLKWTYIMFARGDFSTWVVYDRATWEALVS